MDVTSKIDNFFKQVGEFGPYQALIFTLVGLTSTIPAFTGYSMIYVASVPEFRCKLPFLPNDTFEIFDESHRALVEEYIPLNEVGNYDGCHVRSYVENNTLESCNDWVFSKALYQETIVTKWKLVCDRISTKSLFSSVYFAGWFVSFFFGLLADRYGRKKVAYILIAPNILSNWLLALFMNMPSIDNGTQQILFGICRFLIGAASNVFLIGFVLAIEMVGPSYRLLLSNGCNLFYILGEVITLVLGYLVRDFRTFYIYSALILSVYGLYFWYVPESPRYLLTHDRAPDAFKILQRIAKSNKRTFLPPDMTELPLISAKTEENKAPKSSKWKSMKVIFSSRMIMLRFVITIFNWFTNVLFYFGLSFNIGDFGGDPFLTFLYSILMEIGAVIVGQFVYSHIGRKLPYVIALFMAGVSLFVIQFVPLAHSSIITTLALISKFFISVSFNGVYVVTVEAYPTVIRNSVVTFCSTIARFGSISSPYIQLLGTMYNYTLPFVIYGACACVAAVLYGIFIPETKDVPLKDVLEEMIDEE